MKHIIIIGIAYLLDLIFGDPHWLPHPICLIGNTISFLEKKIRKCIKNELLGGGLLVVLVLALSYVLPFTILFALGKWNHILAVVLETYFCYQILAVKSLKTESMKVYYPLVNGDLQQARKYLSYIVGRDTEKLDQKSVIRATVETIAENTTDGVIAPLLFMAIGGAPLAFLYKAINTMDSMIGYKNEKYILFGRCAAKLDDVANFIPARLAAVLMILASGILRLDFRGAVKIFVRDRYQHKSPNSAQTESVCAGALRVQLAGDAFYFGKPVHKPTIGDALREIVPEDIIVTNRLMYVTSALAVGTILMIFSLISYLF